MTTFNTDDTEGIVFAGKLWGLTQDRRSVKIVGNEGPISHEAFEALRDKDVVVLVSSSPVVPFVVRPSEDFEARDGEWEVIDTSCGNLVATTPDQESAQRVRDALAATAAPTNGSDVQDAPADVLADRVSAVSRSLRPRSERLGY